MSKPYDLRERTLLFACEVVSFCCILAERGVILRRLAEQLLKAGTSIGANMAEAIDGQSKRDFISKVSISLKEARETAFWLRVIVASEKQMAQRAAPLNQEASELIAILTATVKTAKSRPNRGNDRDE
jgi:four helix bundle protein